ncbi:CidA/LrgA family protein [Acidisphaera rubrifaciens]|uniref:Murein hydrolase control protein LrgA n=1 Tax=Acidisphaera rubrifaciens HS-AP3 TaxID=1231350 RepID=A0A0D6P785_9PROT|nr:CidA/LrgA family protein [Acidisphaera rubrifaciens]GAN77073.1 murein hydrolase control protein LrgA [Acidisphaera rubrifaciens HS-AP3]
MLPALTLLIACQFAGEVLVRAAHLTVPGPVIGLLLLIAILIARRGPGPSLRQTTDGLLRNMPLLFVPAGVGVVTQLGVLGRNFVPVACAILASTALGLLTTALVMQWLGRGTRPPDAPTAAGAVGEPGA